MEIKLYRDYTKKEKSNLLYHWFNYYGKKDYTFGELDKFMQIVEEKTDGMFELAVILHSNGKGSTPILDAICNENLDELEKLIVDFKKIPKKEQDDQIKLFILEIVNTYNNPEPSVPFSEGELEKQINEALGGQDVNNVVTVGTVLDPSKVIKLGEECVFTKDEIVNGQPIKEFTCVEGIQNIFFFSTEKLNKNKKEIAELINMLPLMTEIPQSFLGLCMDKNGRQWTGDQGVMDILITLGIACDLIDYAYPKEMWDQLIGSTPLVVKSKKDINAKVIGEPPENFKNYVDEEVIRKQEEEKKEQEQFIEKMMVLAKETFNTNYEKAKPVLEMMGFSISLEDDKYVLYTNKGESLCEMSVSPTMGGFSYEGIVNDTTVEYTHIVDGKNSDGGLIYRDIITVNNIKECDDTYSGKLIKFELGVGLHEVSEVPRIEVTILDPSSDEKITKYYANPYNLSISIDNKFGPYGNYKDGTVRSVHYTNTLITPYVNQGSLLLHESQVNGNAYNISVDRTNTYPEIPAKYAHETTYFKHGNIDNPEETKYSFEGQDKANELACEYLKTTRVKNLYNHILEHIELEVSGMKDFIHQNYPFTEEIEKIMAQNPNSEQEELVNSFAIAGADLKCEKATMGQKELKPNQE